MLRRFLLIALVALAAPAFASTAFAQPTTVTTVERPTFNELFVNPCTFEPVFFLGSQYTFVTHITFDSSDPSFGTHFAQETAVERKGTGLTSGTQYRAPVSAAGSFQDVRGGNPPFVVTSSFTGLIIGSGEVDDFLQHFNVHTTVNANGTVTSTVHNDKTECKG
jgi:hypothetical protein